MCGSPDIPDPPPMPDPLPAPPPPPAPPAAVQPLAPPTAAEPKNPKLKKNSKRGRLKQQGQGADQLRIDLDQSAASTSKVGVPANNKKGGKKGSGVNIPK